MKRVKNYESFKLVDVRKKGVIKTTGEREKILKLILADSAWVPLSDHGDSVTIKFFRLDSIAGRRVYFWDGAIIDSAKLASLTHDDALRLVMVEHFSQAKQLQALDEYVQVNDEYFEVYFTIEDRVVMSPTVCSKRKCDLADHIISYFLYLR